MKPKVSVVIRVVNEAAAIRLLLTSLRNQEGFTQDELEIIVVDNESTDDTVLVAESFGAKIVSIPRDEFNYPYASNKGITAATAPIIVLTSAHCLPLTNHWLRSALPHFDDPQVVGIFGMALPNTRCGPIEWLGHELSYTFACLISPKKITKMRMGTFTARNCAIRKSTWQTHPFDEGYGLGGEDIQWAHWAFAQGYAVVMDVQFTVRHSHGVPLRGYLAQLKLGMHMKKPTVFSREALAHREDIQW